MRSAAFFLDAASRPAWARLSALTAGVVGPAARVCANRCSATRVCREHKIGFTNAPALAVRGAAGLFREGPPPSGGTLRERSDLLNIRTAVQSSRDNDARAAEAPPRARRLR